MVHKPAPLQSPDATIKEVMAFRKESQRTVFRKLELGICESHKNRDSRLITWESVIADRENCLAQGPQLSKRPATGKRPVGRPKKLTNRLIRTRSTPKLRSYASAVRRRHERRRAREAKKEQPRRSRGARTRRQVDAARPRPGGRRCALVRTFIETSPNPTVREDWLRDRRRRGHARGDDAQDRRGGHEAARRFAPAPARHYTS